MQEKEFKEWLSFLDDSTAGNILSWCTGIEKQYGDLDKYYANDKFEWLLKELRYSSKDEKNKKKNTTKIDIKPKKEGKNLYESIREGLASRRKSLKKYK